MTSMLADYFKESQGYEYFEWNDTAFALYRILKPEMHIGHFYIEPKSRKLGLSKLVGGELEKIAKANECSYLSCIVNQEKGKEDINSRLVKIYLDFGFKIVMTDNCNIIMAKELK